MALPSINDLKMWVGTLFTKDDWDYNFSQLVSWLADGNSDIVVNSVKATNGIDLDGAQISNIGAATSGSQAVNLDQATTLLNRTSYYYPFSVASGKVDSNGNAAYLQKDSDTQVTVLAGNVNPDLVCIQSDGTVESVTSNTVLTVPVTNGTYYIVKEKGQAITLTTGSANKVTAGKIFPSTQNTGDYFLDYSVIPFKGYKYGISGWDEIDFCYLGYIAVSGGVANVNTFAYNIQPLISYKQCDGIPVNYYDTLSSTKSEGLHTLDLYNHLPKDGSTYMVYLVLGIVDNGTSTVNQTVTSDVWSGMPAVNTAGDYADRSRSWFAIPVKRYLSYTLSRQVASSGSANLWIVGYRRIGTNS